MAHDVFISYAAQDKTSADMLCATLEQHGVRCWIAPRDVLPGTDWRTAILKAIRGSRAVVLVFSEHANASRHVNREVDCAIESELPVVPFRTENVGPSGALEYSLYGVHWLDALTPPFETHVKRLATLLLAMLAGDAHATKTLARPPRPGPLGLSHLPETAGDPPVTPRRWLLIGVGSAVVIVTTLVLAFAFKCSSAPEVNQPAAPVAASPVAPPAATSAEPKSLEPVEPKVLTEPSAGLPSAAVPPAAPSAPVATGVFTTEQAEFLWQVDPAHEADFEFVWKKLLNGLKRSSRVEFRDAARGLTVSKAGTPENSFYVIHIDPVVSGMNYQAGDLLANSGAFERPEVDALHKRLADGFIGTRALSLERVNLVPGDEPVIDKYAAVKMPKVKSAFVFETNQAQIIWVLKPGQRPDFEAVWRSIVAGLLRSPNERLRQAARGIAAFRTDVDTVMIFRMDHVTKGVSYDPGLLMHYAGTFARPTLDDLLARLTAALESATAWPLDVIR